MSLGQDLYFYILDILFSWVMVFFGVLIIFAVEKMEKISFMKRLNRASKFAKQVWNLVFYVCTIPTEGNRRPLYARRADRQGGD